MREGVRVGVMKGMMMVECGEGLGCWVLVVGTGMVGKERLGLCEAMQALVVQLGDEGM